jgi:hypothetical protein
MNTEITTTTEVTDLQIQRENSAFELLQRQAKMFASSSLVPKDFQGNLANCAIGINIAKRLGADPFMVLQNIDIIHGRPSFRASFLIAMVNASGRFEPLQFRVDGEGQKKSCVAWTRPKGGGEPLEGPPVSLEMAKAEGWSTKNGSKWQTLPDLMLRYRAAAFFARLYAPDITLGMLTVEETQDIAPVRDVTPKVKSASQSKLFVAPEPAPLVEVAAESVASQIAGKCAASGIAWSDVARIACDNGLADDIYQSPEQAPDTTLSDILSAWSQIELAAK